MPPLTATADFSVLARSAAGNVPPRQRWLAFGVLASASGGVAIAFLLAGVWLVLPYSLLELAGVAIAFFVVERRARDWERLTVDGDRVIVERSIGGREERHEFNRRWLRVDVDDAGGARAPRLALRYAGATLPFGGALPAGERLALAKTLRQLTAGR